MPPALESATRPASPDGASATPARVWDLPKRMFHWVVAAAVAAQLATGFGDVVKRHRLVRPIISGDKLLAHGSAATSRDDAASRLLTLVVFVACAVFAAWIASPRA